MFVGCRRNDVIVRQLPANVRSGVNTISLSAAVMEIMKY